MDSFLSFLPYELFPLHCSIARSPTRRYNNCSNSFIAKIHPLLILLFMVVLLRRIRLRRLVSLSCRCNGLEVFYSSLVFTYFDYLSFLRQVISGAFKIVRYLGTFWAQRSWATAAALLSFVFDLVGSILRYTIIMKCIADHASYCAGRDGRLQGPWHIFGINVTHSTVRFIT